MNLNLDLAVYGNGLAVVMTTFMNHIDCVTKREVYPQKMHLCTKNICGISIKKKYIMGDIAKILA